MNKEAVNKIVNIAENSIVQMKRAVEDLKLDIRLADDVCMFENYVITRVIERLEEVATIATMERANFHKLLQEPIESDPTEMIKERTELWRNSWIVGPLQNVIEILKGHKNAL